MGFKNLWVNHNVFFMGQFHPFYIFISIISVREIHSEMKRKEEKNGGGYEEQDSVLLFEDVKLVVRKAW